MPWLFANLGYDTGRNLWFLECFDDRAQNADFHTAKELKIVNGWGHQFQFHDDQNPEMWHVRERIFRKDVASVKVEEDTLTITFVDGQEFSREVPDKWDYLLYAYSIRSQVPWGFVEFYEAGGKQVGKVLEVMVSVEHLDHFTVGTYPKIRFRANREGVEKVVLTDYSATIVGRKALSQGRVTPKKP